MMNDDARFWEKVDVGGEDECWPWMAYRDKRGYGRFWHDGAMRKSHRYSLSLSTGGDKGREYNCLHSCDNPPCCNPKHLNWGSHKDNSDDKVAKDRHYKGENHHNSVYTNEIADSILRMKMEGFNIHEIAAGLGLTNGGVLNVYIGRSWKHRHGVDGNPTLEQIKAKRPDRRLPRKKRQDTFSPVV